MHFSLMKVVDLVLSFQMLPKLVNFDIYNSSYSQINGQMSDSDKTTISTSQQNLRLLGAKLDFSFKIKVVRLFLSFLSK